MQRWCLLYQTLRLFGLFCLRRIRARGLVATKQDIKTVVNDLDGDEWYGERKGRTT